MVYFIVKCAVSGVLIGGASTLARRYPGFGALIASLPLVSILGMVWLWRERPDPAIMADHAQATFWYVLPSLPMFLVIPALLRSGVGFWAALAVGCALTVFLYSATVWAGSRLGLPI